MSTRQCSDIFTVVSHVAVQMSRKGKWPSRGNNIYRGVKYLHTIPGFCKVYTKTHLTLGKRTDE